jgi:hypothetical protein
MERSNLGAVRRLLLVSAVLTLSPLAASAQIVERSQTWANLIQSHPCNAGLNGRHTILTDAQSSSSIGGGGGSTRVFVECDGVDTWSIVSIGGGASGPSDALASTVVIEGTTADAFEGNFTFADPTADWTWAWGATGNVTIPGNIQGPTAGFTLFGGTSTTADLTFQVTTGVGTTGSDMHFLVGNNGAVEALKLSHDSTATIAAAALVVAANGNVGIKPGGGYYNESLNAGVYFPNTATLSLYSGAYDNFAALRKIGSGDFRFALDDGLQLAWVASSTAEAGTLDTGLARSAAGIVAVTDGSTGGGAFHLTPLASPPRTCDAAAEGDIYSDTSHALCWCDASAWQKLSGAGTCA